MTDQPSTGVNPAQIDTRTNDELVATISRAFDCNHREQVAAGNHAKWELARRADESKQLREELQRSLDSELLAMRNNESLRAELERTREMLQAWQDSYGTGSPNPYEIAVAELERSQAVIEAAKAVCWSLRLIPTAIERNLYCYDALHEALDDLAAYEAIKPADKEAQG